MICWLKMIDDWWLMIDDLACLDGIIDFLFCSESTKQWHYQVMGSRKGKCWCKLRFFLSLYFQKFIACIPTVLNLILLPLLTVFKLWNIIESESGEFLINCFMGNWQEVGCSGGWMGGSIRLPTPITGPRSRGHFLSGFTITSNQGPSQDQYWLHSGAAIIRNIHYVWHFEVDIFQGEDLFCPIACSGRQAPAPPWLCDRYCNNIMNI